MTAATATQPARDATHELVLHDGAPDLVDLSVPFLRDGAAAGDHLVVLGEPDFVSALLSAAPDLPGAPRLEVLAEPASERVPARDLHRFERILGQRARTGSRVRVVNQMPPMSDAGWPEWRRYEAAVNVVLGHFPVWGTCGYDSRGLDAGVVADLRASHRAEHPADGGRPGVDLAELESHVGGYLDVPPHPVEDTVPTLVMARATPVRARQAVRALAVRAALPPAAEEAVVLATNEAVANAHLHGRAPVVLRAWVTGDRTDGTDGTDGPDGSGGIDDSGGTGSSGRDTCSRVTVAVSDTGPGPHPLVGLVPVERDESTGGGLWIVHLLLPDVHHRTGPEGYTVTFSVDRTTTLPGVTGPA